MSVHRLSQIQSTEAKGQGDSEVANKLHSAHGRTMHYGVALQWVGGTSAACTMHATGHWAGLAQRQ